MDLEGEGATMKLSEAQKDILGRMQRDPDAIHTADRLQAAMSTMLSLSNKGLVSGVVGNTRSMGPTRGMWWKLTAEGKKVQP